MKYVCWLLLLGKETKTRCTGKLNSESKNNKKMANNGLN